MSDFLLRSPTFDSHFRNGWIKLDLAIIRPPSPRVRENPDLPRLEFLARFTYSSVPGEPAGRGVRVFLLVNPSLELSCYRRTGANSHASAGIRLPVFTGSFPATPGGLWASTEALEWRPYALFSPDLITALDRLRDVEKGILLDWKLHAVVLDLTPSASSAASRSGTAYPRPSTLSAEKLSYSGSFVLLSEPWRELLAAWGWPRPRVFELDPRAFDSLEAFEVARAELEAAQARLLAGNWEDAVAHARKVVEAVLKQLGYKQGKTKRGRQATQEAYRKAGVPKEMGKLIEAFNALVARAHHPEGPEEGPAPSWGRAEARFLVQLAAALAEYGAHLPEFESLDTA